MSKEYVENILINAKTRLTHLCIVITRLCVLPKHKEKVSTGFAYVSLEKANVVKML